MHASLRKLGKLRRDPERYFLDSPKPSFQFVGRSLVRCIDFYTARLRPLVLYWKPYEALAPVHACSVYEQPRISIIVPVFNAYEEVELCLKSLVRHSRSASRIIILNDASTDERVAGLLERYASEERIAVLHNSRNLGFTRTINKGIEFAGSDDVVLLNSDTQVGPRWLENLLLAVYQDNNIATATPLSNNAGAFSAPVRSCCNEFPECIDHTDLSRALFQDVAFEYPEAPTGNGFCMYVRRKALDQVGLFDDAAFPRGYCEENDWCQRAIGHGWRHVVDARTCILHRKAASFGAEREGLIKFNRQILDQRFPAYCAQVRRFMKSKGMKRSASRVARILNNLQKGDVVKPRILFVISSEAGGTPFTNADLMKGIRDAYSPFLLTCNGRTLKLWDVSGDEAVLLHRRRLATPVRPPQHYSDDYDKYIGYLLIKYGIELIHIRHVSFHSLNLPKIAKSINIPVVFSFHDFYLVCPNTQLLDELSIHCEGRCTNTPGDCDAPLWGRGPAIRLKNEYVHVWRGIVRELLTHCDVFVTTSKTAKSLIAQAYPEVESKPFPLIPHGRDFQNLYAPLAHDIPGDQLRIVFPGNLNRAKGMDLILALRDLDKKDRILDIHLLGKITPEYRVFLDSGITFHGPYKREDFAKHMHRIRPHFVGLFSLWPETFCHTLTEAWASGVPVLATSFGALQERVQNAGAGLLLPSTDPAQVYDFLLEFRKDWSKYEALQKALSSWQQHTAPSRTIRSMAESYMAIYKEIMY